MYFNLILSFNTWLNLKIRLWVSKSVTVAAAHLQAMRFWPARRDEGGRAGLDPLNNKLLIMSKNFNLACLCRHSQPSQWVSIQALLKYWSCLCSFFEDRVLAATWYWGGKNSYSPLLIHANKYMHNAIILIKCMRGTKTQSDSFSAVDHSQSTNPGDKGLWDSIFWITSVKLFVR